MRRRLLALAALALALALPAGAHAARASGAGDAQPRARAADASTVESLLLDAYDPVLNEQPTVIAKTHLIAGHPYVITVEGTFSIVDPTRWFVPHPLLPSPGIANGRVGTDAEVQFARTTQQGCSGAYPRPHNRFQIDVGTGFRHVKAVGGPFEQPAPGDRYAYDVVGTGAAPRFRIFDTPADDNYGMLRIVIVDPAPAGPTTTPPSTPPSVGVPSPGHPLLVRVCTARRVFTLRLRRGAVRRLRVTAGGRRMRVRYSRRYVTVRVDLRRTHGATARVRFALLTRAGRHLVRIHTYRTCAHSTLRAQKDDVRTSPAKREPTPAS
jgi:hypothetical protein